MKKKLALVLNLPKQKGKINKLKKSFFVNQSNAGNVYTFSLQRRTLETLKARHKSIPDNIRQIFSLILQEQKTNWSGILSPSFISLTF